MPNQALCFFSDAIRKPLLHLLYIQFWGYSVPYPLDIMSRGFCAVEICWAEWNLYQLSEGQIFCPKNDFYCDIDSEIDCVEACIGHIDATVSVMCSHYVKQQEIIHGQEFAPLRTYSPVGSLDTD